MSRNSFSNRGLDMLFKFGLLAILISIANAIPRGRPHLDTSLGRNTLLSDQNTLLRGVSLSFDGGDPWGSLPVNLPSLDSLISLKTEYGLNTVHLFLEGDAAQNPDPVGVNVEVADQLVQLTADAGLYLIITIGNNGENGSIHSMQKTLDFWNFYGPRYGSNTHVIFEAHNEPVAFTPNHWAQEDWDKQVTIYNTIRAVASNTFILLGSFMSFNGGDAAISGADYLASNGVDWSNAGFAFHGYTGLGSIEDTIAPFETSLSYPALLCTEFWPGDTENGYNAAFESHFVGWMQFEWLSGNDVDLTSFQYKINTAGTVWTPDEPTATWPANGTLSIPSATELIAIYSRSQNAFLRADISDAYELTADINNYNIDDGEAFFFETVGAPAPMHRVYMKEASSGKYVSTTSESDVVKATLLTGDVTAMWDYIGLPNGDIVLRSVGGGGHLLATFPKGRYAGKSVARGDNANVEAFAILDGSEPQGPPPEPEPPAEPDSGPFNGSPSAIPGTIRAADFDYGGEGVAYHDSDPENVGGAYRPNEGVDIQASSDGINPNVGWVIGGEWMEYTVNIASTDSYTLTVRLASGGSGGDFHYEFDGVPTSTMTTGGTGGWQSWVDVSEVIQLTAGEQKMRFISDSCDANLLTFTLTQGGVPPTGGGDIDVFVNSIEMSTSQAGGNRSRGVAVVQIFNADGMPVPGVTVSGDWSGLVSGSVTGNTGTDGRATLNSAWKRNAVGTFTFTVTDVQGSGYMYVPASNIETSDSITL